jgi:hypothetical protein
MAANWGHYTKVNFAYATLPDLVPDVPPPAQPRPMRPAVRPVYDPHAFYPDEEGLEWGA